MPAAGQLFMTPPPVASGETVGEEEEAAELPEALTSAGGGSSAARWMDGSCVGGRSSSLVARTFMMGFGTLIDF